MTLLVPLSLQIPHLMPLYGRNAHCHPPLCGLMCPDSHDSVAGRRNRHRMWTIFTWQRRYTKWLITVTRTRPSTRLLIPSSQYRLITVIIVMRKSSRTRTFPPPRRSSSWTAIEDFPEVSPRWWDGWLAGLWDAGRDWELLPARWQMRQRQEKRKIRNDV